ncbi:hypothetical protein [Pectobacterium atrosepticum]|uniref:hypothetical protein n=1 Tax=Pectobacterium atrosepticum TaxID=29471 RepID=UPI000CDD938F|nr:hypothetical protein [Pectobacterium atrosepticum]POW23623.1 hypothetical protein PB72LOC_04460 [Pectobacterium atrosepticum]
MSEIPRTLEIDLSKSSRRGKFNTEKIPIDALRGYCVSVRFNKEELELLNEKRGATKKGEWLRMALLHRLPPIVPSINIEAWKCFGDLSQKLNRILVHLDNKSSSSPLTKTEIFVIQRQIRELRQKLISVNSQEASSDEGNAED